MTEARHIYSGEPDVQERAASSVAPAAPARREAERAPARRMLLRAAAGGRSESLRSLPALRPRSGAVLRLVASRNFRSPARRRSHALN